jgi:hypothetical protein
MFELRRKTESCINSGDFNNIGNLEKKYAA